MRETETAISGANRRLRDLGDSRRAAEAEIAELEKQSAELGVRIAGQQKQLAAMLYRRYLHGESDALQLLLSGEDPNRIAQDEYFLNALSKAKARMLGTLRDDLAHSRKLADARRDKVAALASIEQRQQAERTALVARQKERQAVLARIAGEIRSQRRQIDTLKNDERRLTQLIAGLSRVVRRPVERKPVHGRESPAPRVEATPDTASYAYSGNFAALRGKLRLPVRGEIAGRFGKPRSEGGTWKGLFIRSAEGSEVKAVAAGRVVFADWLRGFGNLIIVDHGSGYMSLYGHNEALLKQVGAQIKAGDVIARAGNSGGNAETGLYFEIRHRGAPLDPAQWVRF